MKEGGGGGLEVGVIDEKWCEVEELNRSQYGIYAERNAMELKLTGIAKSLQKPHKRNNNRQGSSGRDIFIENSLAFLNWSRNRFFPYKSL